MKKITSIFISILILAIIFGFGISKADTVLVFTKNLYFGIKGDSDVKELQEFLTAQKIYSGPITGNFFSLTKEAVKQFQIIQNIAPATGYFGPVTRARANSLSSNQIPSASFNAVSDLQSRLNLLTQQLQILQKQQISNAIPSATTSAPASVSISTPTSTSAASINVSYVTQPDFSSGIKVTPLGLAASRAKNTVDDIGRITFSVSGVGGAISLNQIKLTIAGNLATSTFASTGAATDDIKLIDPATGLPVSGTASSTGCSGSNCVFTFTIASPATSAVNGYVISPGASKDFIIRVNSLSHTAIAAGGQSDTLNISIANAGDITYVDSLDGAGSAINLPANVVPIVINSVSYAPGT